MFESLVCKGKSEEKRYGVAIQTIIIRKGDASSTKVRVFDSFNQYLHLRVFRDVGIPLDIALGDFQNITSRLVLLEISVKSYILLNCSVGDL